MQKAIKKNVKMYMKMIKNLKIEFSINTNKSEPYDTNEENYNKKFNSENQYLNIETEMDGNSLNFKITSENVVAESTMIENCNVTKSFECSLNGNEFFQQFQILLPIMLIQFLLHKLFLSVDSMI